MIEVGLRGISGIAKIAGGGILAFSKISEATTIIGGIIVVLGIIDIAVARAMMKERSSK